MEFKRWTPTETVSKQEELILKQFRHSRKLLPFLRLHRRELFDDSFQEELEGMYRSTGAGKPPLPPALLAMAVLLQGYFGLSDADAVRQSALDLGWQMVLDRLGSTNAYRSG